MITFVIPTHNYGRFLKKCITSIYKNNPKFVKEIIIVNDGSTDGTDLVIRKLKKKIKFKYYKKNFLSLPKTMNFAISKSRGNIICKIDADDFIENNFAIKMGNKFTELNSDFLYSNVIIRDKLSNNTFIKNQEVRSFFKLLKYPHGSGTLFKKSLWKKVDGFEEKNFYQDDYDFWLKINKLKKIKIRYCNLALYNYHKHSSNMSDNLLKKNFTKIKILIQNLLK